MTTITKDSTALEVLQAIVDCAAENKIYIGGRLAWGNPYSPETIRQDAFHALIHDSYNRLLAEAEIEEVAAAKAAEENAQEEKLRRIIREEIAASSSAKHYRHGFTSVGDPIEGVNTVWLDPTWTFK